MKRFLLVTALLLAIVPMLGAGCDDSTQPDTTGKVHQAAVDVTTDADGLTVEQKNISRRILADNDPGAIKHLYLISPYTGDVLLYSAVKGKVTSGGKRLKPKTAAAYYDTGSGNTSTYTQEVMNDDGTFGSSSDYIYWFDVYGTYHQEILGAAIVHISSKPLRVKKAIINIAPAQ